MAMWLFRRKGSRKQSRVASTTGDFETAGRGRQDQPPDPRQIASTTDITNTNHSPSAAKSKQRKPSAKLQRRPRAYSFSPDRHESIRVTRARQGSFPLPAATNDDGSVYRVPTLHHNTSRHKRSGQHLPRKKSSKRRKEDHDREAEIKAMSQFMPVRPVADEWTSGRPIKRESRRVRSTLNHKSWEGHPSSDVSLPMPESIHSSLSSESEQVSYKVSALAALVPRPTLRYSSNPLNPSASTPGPLRASSGSKKLSQKEPIAEATLKAHKRVDDLADDLDAAALRELMERDQRRREQKKERERERVERRLTRRAERQRLADDEARRSGNPSPPNLDRGVLGREITSTEPETTSAVVTSSRRRRNSNQSTTAQVEGPTGADKLPKRDSSPLDSFHRTDSIPLDHDAPTADPQPEVPPQAEPQDESASKRSSSPKLMSLIRPKKTRSNSPRQSSTQLAVAPAPPKTDDAESSGGRTSDSRSSRPWTSFFKWPGKNRRNSGGPSSFSNTSRDSIMAAQANQPPREAPTTKVNSSVPKRTLSRFREDLPELPMSPPDSRKASPDTEQHAEPLPPIPDDVQMRYDTPSEPKSHEEPRSAPIPIPRDQAQPSPAPQSMSLASIDSEASWLSSGRMSRQRASSGLRNSLAAPAERIVSDASETQDSHMADYHDDPIGDDEYLDSVVPSRLRRKSTGEARPSSDEEEDVSQEAKWGAVGRVPTVMHHRDTMKSTEGLLIGTMDDDEEDEMRDPEKDDEKSSQQTSEEGNDSPVEPQRARSVNLGKGHVRNFSAGSAKLLELSPRASGEHRRSSTIERGAQ